MICEKDDPLSTTLQNPTEEEAVVSDSDQGDVTKDGGCKPGEAARIAFEDMKDQLPKEWLTEW